MISQLQRIKDSGCMRVKVLGPGEGNYCCAACSLLVDREFSVDNAPELPPSDCKCDGGSKIMYIAVEEPKEQTSQAALSEKTKDAGDKMQALGCALTIFVTIPILILFLLLFVF
ncbi:hypothetical protein DDZ13_07395 [Coraliomargarita sinensis]|uniref:Uncharacterized protein n=1 Tax=Coraliomargarita sinensis TaxID=2174842 RepID=A0A317ZKK7_9BACT|nr:hypothetical protein [Coraliomargarita sinensis]PXA04349.1 hypothetical protein DDZ13_07395 [Coraliomargarita sinensis]